MTSDGGEHWSLTPLKEFPRSIFFLDESNGWMVTGESLWFTQEAGRSWARISDQIKPNKKLADAPHGGLILRVWFLDAQHGYAVGLQSVLEQRRRHVEPVEEAARANPAFSGIRTLLSRMRAQIFGSYEASAGGKIQRRPAGLDDPRACPGPAQPRGWSMDTRDSGATGNPARPHCWVQLLAASGQRGGLAVFGYADSFEWPSEAYRLNLATARARACSSKKRQVTDTALFGRAGISRRCGAARSLRSAPIPGR